MPPFKSGHSPVAGHFNVIQGAKHIMSSNNTYDEEMSPQRLIGSCMSNNDLLRELFKRNALSPAPNNIKLISPHKECIVGIGKDHTASIIIDEGALNDIGY